MGNKSTNNGFKLLALPVEIITTVFKFLSLEEAEKLMAIPILRYFAQDRVFKKIRICNGEHIYKLQKIKQMNMIAFNQLLLMDPFFKFHHISFEMCVHNLYHFSEIFKSFSYRLSNTPLDISIQQFDTKEEFFSTLKYLAGFDNLVELYLLVDGVPTIFGSEKYIVFNQNLKKVTIENMILENSVKYLNLGSMPNLTHLSLVKSYINYDNSQWIDDLSPFLESLEITGGESNFTNFNFDFERLKFLRNITITGTLIESIESWVLPENLVSLDLSYNNISFSSNTFKFPSRLKVLKLCGVKFKEDMALPEFPVSLIELDLQSNNLVNSNANTLHHLHNLEVLNISDNAELDVSKIRFPQRLIELNIESTVISPFMTLPSSLQNLYMGTAYVLFPYELFIFPSYLQILSIEGSIQSLTNSIRFPETLYELSMSYCDIKYLTSISFLPNLRKLKLKMNAIEKIEDTFQFPSKLGYINFDVDILEYEIWEKKFKADISCGPLFCDSYYQIVGTRRLLQW